MRVPQVIRDFRVDRHCAYESESNGSRGERDTFPGRRMSHKLQTRDVRLTKSGSNLSNSFKIRNRRGRS